MLPRRCSHRAAWLRRLMVPVVIEREEGTSEVYARFEEDAEGLLMASVGLSMGRLAGGRNASCRRISIC